ncbi:hypothetical protein P171DRAFT_43295 [Karstenula rhodostoma CBS 690.94]|uniref:Uncharacterized protein n=1 Tax=Karstenula rhodostoma CBS 690.94 TaxID=1392251 RepID=A0A9P4UB52_9PLEO|nr:hypothetical protein P171DRAFT_43295 [Karstenula rhodostoma CBS 690.94]
MTMRSGDAVSSIAALASSTTGTLTGMTAPGAGVRVAAGRALLFVLGGASIVPWLSA